MAKAIWVPGIPEEDGVYWYDSGHGSSEFATVMQVRSSSKYIFGDFGTMPLSSIFVPSMIDRVSYAEINDDYDWQDYTCVKGRSNRAWVKKPDGMIGFALLNQGWHFDVYGTWLWPSPCINASEDSKYIKGTENYQFSLVEKVKVRKKK